LADGVVLQAGAEGACALLVAGRPLREPIVQHGPFVMNTQQEIFEAVEDFRAGRLG
jgi:redox-sensitive bicupin YhaK (pirin superfamily)